MLKKYGKLIFLVVLLVIVTELTIYVNNQVDSKLDTDERVTTVEKLRNQLANSTADNEGLNPYTEFWIYELEYFKENYPKSQEDLFTDTVTEQFNTKIDALITQVKTEYVDDVTLINSLKDMIKDLIGTNYIADIFSDNMDEGYFRSIILLMEDDAKNQ